jgi:hypothetical protein
MPDLQGYAGQCMPSSSVTRLLGQCPLGSPSLFPPPAHSSTSSGLLSARPSPQTVPHPSTHYWFPMWTTLPPFLSLYSWLFCTRSSVCSHLLTLVPHSQIFLPWRWRQYIPPKCRFTQELHGATSQKTAFFISNYLFEVGKVGKLTGYK